MRGCAVRSPPRLQTVGSLTLLARLGQPLRSLPKPRLLSPRRKAASTRLSSLTSRAALTLSTRHPSLALDNNAAERSLRRVVMGRANFFFVGHEASGHRHAGLYTLINSCQSCQQHGRNPVDYLTDVLTRIKAYPARDIIDLLPHRWRPPDDPAPPIPP